MWGRAGFGPMDPVHMVRATSAGLVCLTLGVEAIFASFFLSVLGYVKKS
jgi:hypothetical protein